jgi:hypothetical protein
MSEMMDYLKAVSHPDRLRIVGLLTRQPHSRSDVCAQLHMPMQKVAGHLAYLETVEVVSRVGGLYELNADRLATLTRDHLAQERPAYHPADHLPESTKKVLKNHLNPDGSIRQLPGQPGKLRVVLDYVVQHFESGRNYSEKEVNMILCRFHEDVAGLRRDLVDRDMLKRESDGSRYWLPMEGESK